MLESEARARAKALALCQERADRYITVLRDVEELLRRLREVDTGNDVLTRMHQRVREVVHGL